jgi:tRNA(His) guanylyltransferase
MIKPRNINKERISSFEENTNYKLLTRLPLVITINGRSFSKLTSLLDKPFSNEFAECMYSTMSKLVQEIDGSFFGFASNDEITIISRNDQHADTTPWYDNNIQKIVSVVSSIATYNFNNAAASIEMNVLGDTIFTTNVFAAPSINEVANIAILKQQQAIFKSINFACLYELINKYDRDTIKDMLVGMTFDDKIDLLQEECGTNYNNYPLSFRRGVACYRAPKITQYKEQEVIKSKWLLDMEIPIFSKDEAFIASIFK